MKRLAVLAVLVTILLPAGALAADLGVNGTTLFRFRQQSTPGAPKKNLAPATQYLGVDADGIADANLSFHLYGWGRVDLTDESPVDGRTTGDISYGYLRYHFPKANAEIKAGRFFVVEGVANEQVDGVSVRSDLPAGLTLSLYGGAPAAMDVERDARGDYLAGARLSYKFAGKGEIGFSTLFADKSPSRQVVGGMTLQTVENQRQLVGGDIWLAPLPILELNGRTTYNSVTSSVGEHDYTLTLKPAKIVTATGSFAERRMKGLYSGTNLPFLFDQFAGDKVRTYSGSVSVAVAKPLELTADYRHTRRDSYGSSDRYGVEARATASALMAKAGISYHRINATDVRNTTGAIIPSYGLSHHELRGWLLHEHGKHNVSLDAIGYFYDDKTNPNLNGKPSSYEIIASAGYRVLPTLMVSGDLSYGANPLYNDEFKGLVRAEFSFSTTGKGGNK
ncbi:hypothetical protein [Geobacter argillaceus]|uniref:Beta-barrel porin 2 n=1 Tax=Geobacter argillaceus TaxID=345631 RepID=A0A562V7M3_9BACT|nr:hypothetical protein [Geobacter argillaceus]TWJ13891.1 hypothetical protein JN12_03681 [Geobacter argillaceus]